MPEPVAADAGGERVKASPVARRVARERGVDLSSLTGTGPGGRILKSDVESAACRRRHPPPLPLPLRPLPRPPDTRGVVGAAAVATASGKGDVTTTELTRTQSLIARRMAESRATVPTFTLRATLDMTSCVQLRQELKAALDASEQGPLPSFNDLVVKACAIALAEHPRANGAYKDATFEHYSRVNVGVAVAAEDTLVVPTIFDADLKGLSQIARETRALAQRVREGTITPPELSGATFTVSNLGMFGVRSFEAIINSPQAAILSVGALEPRPARAPGRDRDPPADGRRAGLRPSHPLRCAGGRVPRPDPQCPADPAEPRPLMPRSGDRLTARQRAERRAARAMSNLSPRAQVRLSGKPQIRVDDQALDPEMQLTLALLERRGDPPIETLPPAQARRVMRAQATLGGGKGVKVRSVRDLTIDGAAGPLRARHYAPDEPGGPHPLLVFFHGGGFVIGDLESHDSVCRMLCRHAGVHVLAVDYRLAPEHPFPAADRRRARRPALGVRERRCARRRRRAGRRRRRQCRRRTSRPSSPSSASRDEGPAPVFQLLIYPGTGGAEPTRSHELFAEAASC